MTDINEMTPLFLVPLDGTTLLDAMTDGGESPTRVATERPGERPTLLDGEIPVVEVVEDHDGWCLVALCPIVEDMKALAAFVTGRDGLTVTEEIEAAREAAGDMLDQMGALAACRVKGRWRPIHEDERPMWSRHLADCNTQKLRAAARTAREVANDDAAAARAA